MKNTLNKTKAIINKYNIKANKRFGQNFLIDDDILNKIIEVSKIKEDELILEIGPGLGNLTEYLLDNSKFVIAFEIDKNMIEILNNRFINKDNLLILNEDVLKIEIDKIIDELEKRLSYTFNNVKVIANLPYYITTPILFKLLQDFKRINNLVIMVQKEVAERIVAKPGSKDYGILTIMVNYMSNSNIEFLVPNTSFLPPPNVTSAVISLEKRSKYNVEDEKIFFELVHKAFAQRRKKLSNSLYMNKFLNKEKIEIDEILINCGVYLNSRAEEISIEKYVEISNYVYKNTKIFKS